LRSRRIQAALPFLKGRILDVGCGSGALARYVETKRYVGVDIDEESLAIARAQHPDHAFLPHLPVREKFETISALAVIEHVPRPEALLTELKSMLQPGPDARIVCTTPHPSMDWIHWIGSRIGLFSRSANDEHHELLDRRRLAAAGEAAGLKVMDYRRFLWGANQVVTYVRSDG